jgi:hypothetical protein
MHQTSRMKTEEGIPMKRNVSNSGKLKWYLLAFFLLFALGFYAHAEAFTLRVVDERGNPVTGFRWLVEEDTTNVVTPGTFSARTLGVNIHTTYAPVVANGRTTSSSATINVSSAKRYLVSVLPDSDSEGVPRFTANGKLVEVGAKTVTVVVNTTPIPTAQISVFIFKDTAPINNAPDLGEPGLANFSVLLFDQLGQVSQDAFGNELGTDYVRNADGSFQFNADGTPVIKTPGAAEIITCTQAEVDAFNAWEAIRPLDYSTMPRECRQVGEALIKYIPPGKYGTRVIPPHGETWIQTATIEGTPGIDSWVKANEPNRLVEFGPALYHVFIGFVQPFDNLQALRDLCAAQPPIIDPVTGLPTPVDCTPANVTGNIRRSHSTKAQFAITPGPPVSECWIGINALEAGTTTGYYAAACNADSTFTIPNLPPGTYQLVAWDLPLDYIFYFTTFIVQPGTPVDLTDQVFMNAWFGNIKGTVFYDKNQNGYRDCVTPACDNAAAGDEVGVNSQIINLRWRDGSIYQFTKTLLNGDYSLNEVFPLFRNYIIEVDYARLKATGATIYVDDGGIVNPNPPFDGELNPRPQFCTLSDIANGTIADYGPDKLAGTADDVLCTSVTQPIIHPFRGDNLGRLEQGVVLLEATTIYADQTNIIDWGKTDYAPGEHGGIVGVAVYNTTRAEKDPRLAATDPWEPGIPRVQFNLYADFNADGVIDDADGNGRIELADVDNYPFCWSDPAFVAAHPDLCPKGQAKGPEDVVRCGNGRTFCRGDALNIVTSDSWDDNLPTGCQGPTQYVYGQPIRECSETLQTWNTVRPGVFDGGYFFDVYYPFTTGSFKNPSAAISLPADKYYIVEVALPPGFQITKEEDKNVEFGDTYVPSPLLAPAPCVGTPANKQPVHVVPPYLALFPEAQIPAFRAGQTTPLCNMRQVLLGDGQNAAADFHLFTEVPKAARGVGLITNDVAVTLDPNNPIVGEKAGTVWLPISVQDFNGHELTRVYTDQFGTYNFLAPATYSVNIPVPTGVSPNMLRLCLNHPGPIPDPANPSRFITDPYFDSRFSLTCYTFDFWPGKTTYLDTPVIPVASFAAIFNASLDCEQPSGTPAIMDVTGPGAVGPIVNAGQTLTIISAGTVSVPNPACNSRFDPACPATVLRDYGFGGTKGTVKIGGVTIPANNVNWTNQTIAVTIPQGTLTGQLEIIRGDNGRAAVSGITVTIGPLPAGQTVRTVLPGQSIQAAINAALDGDLIIVRPGKYDENIIMNKRVKLQGSGAFSTVINSAPTLPENLQLIRQKIGALLDAHTAQLVPGENLDLHIELAAITVIPIEGRFTQADNARIDGLSIMSATSGGAITVNGFAHYLQISNNRLTNNAGTYGGGVRLGTPGLIDPATGGYTDNKNDNITIHHNQILTNGSVGATTGGGGIAIHNGSTNYDVTENYICGNFTTSKGAGISHVGLSDGGFIAHNKILLNESSFNSIQGGEGGGILVRGEPSLLPGGLTPGTGSVQILANLIQGNLAGNGKGGGIFLSFVNGLDVQASPAVPANWYGVDIFNNMIVNNVAGWVGAGIYLEDAAKVRIIHNTIANNSSTATGANALLAVGLGQPTVPTGAGVVGGIHSAGLAGLLAGQAHSDPLLKNNIIWHNTSYGYLPDPNNPLAGLFLSGYWDLQVFNSDIVPAPIPAGVVLHPVNCVLTSLTGPDGVNYTGNGNLGGVDPLFEADFVYTLQSAAAPGEGGNTVQVTFTPIEPRGDYHLQETSPVRGIAPNPGIAEVNTDYDGENRTFPADTGADQFNPPPVLTVDTLTLVELTGTQVVRTGSTLPISWLVPATFPPTVTYKVQVSFKNGGGFSWKNIPGAEALTTTTFNWHVPAMNANAPLTRIRVQAFDGGKMIAQATSAQPFEVEAMKLLYPSDAKVEVFSGLTLAPPYGINFRFNDVATPVAQVRIEISMSGGRFARFAKWQNAVIAGGNPILNPIANQEYQLTWTVPAVAAATNAKVRMLLLDGSGRTIGSDEGDIPLTILPPQ